MHNTKNEKTTLVPLQKLENYPQVFPTRFVNCNQQQQKNKKQLKPLKRWNRVHSVLMDQFSKIETNFIYITNNMKDISSISS